MDIDLVKTLIAHGREDPALEWKEKLCIHDKAGQAELVRDMLSLVNAHATGRRYLLIGIGNDGTVIGVEERIDDATLQQIVNNRVEPPIEFSTRYVTSDARTIGIIEIAKSSKRFHVVSRDLEEKGKQHLRRGDAWVKKGSSKGPPDAWDYERLREAVAENSVPQPIIRASFEDRVDEITVFPSWSSPDREPAQNHLASPLAFLSRVEKPPPGTAELLLMISNDGEHGADGVRVFIDPPEGCKVWEPGISHLTALTPPGSVGIWVDKDDNRIVMRAEKLVHGLHTHLMAANVTFPASDRTYELTWSGHASNMRKPTAGVLKVKVA